jgi:methyl-accepting chemotaxis protein
MKKFNKSDLYDCGACGYGSCKGMAAAIYNGINKPENCAHYTLAMLKEKKDTEELNRLLNEHIGRASGLIEDINKLVHELNSTIGSQYEAVDQSTEVTGKMIDSIRETSEISRNRQESLKGLIENAVKSQESMRGTIQSVGDISKSVDGIADAIKIISAIAANTNLLSMNAAIEAAHAGEAGRGFAVVADAIRRLSENTGKNSRNISLTLKNIISGIAVTSKQSGDTGSRITEMSKEISGFAQTMNSMIDAFGKLSAGSSEITSVLDYLRDQSSIVKTGYAEMLSMTENLRTWLTDLTALSEKNNDS